jgi:hypothetical protein
MLKVENLCNVLEPDNVKELLDRAGQLLLNRAGNFLYQNIKSLHVTIEMEQMQVSQ